MTDLQINFPSGRLRIEYIPVTTALSWEWQDNPKRHDIERLKKSILTYGFRDASIFDAALDPPGLVAGNGRVKAVFDLYKKKSGQIPLGIGIVQEGEHKGEWAVPIQFGIDSVSQIAAEAFAVDHNNLTIVGLSDEEVALIWDPKTYVEVLERLEEKGEPPISISDQTRERLQEGHFLGDIQALVSDREPSSEPTEPKGEDQGPKFEEGKKLADLYKIKKGQVWKLGPHLIACGDCRDTALLKQLFKRTKGALLIGDPPYGAGKESEGIENDNLYREKLDRFQMEWWTAVRPYLMDNASAYLFGYPEDLWRLWYVGGLSESERITFRNEVVWDKNIEGENETMFVTGVPLESRRMYHPTERALFFMLGEQEFNINSDHYWEGWESIRSYLAGEVEKMGWGPKDIQEITGVGMFGHWFTKSQWAFIPEEHYKKLQAAAGEDVFEEDHAEIEGEFRKFKKSYDELKAEFYSTRAFFDNTHDRMTDVWRFPRVQGEERRDHPTPKDLSMIERMILSSSREKDIIVSPFLGSGTDLIGAHRLKRRLRGVELEPRYFAITIQRWVDLTGGKPVRVIP